MLVIFEDRKLAIDLVQNLSFGESSSCTHTHTNTFLAKLMIFWSFKQENSLLFHHNSHLFFFLSFSSFSSFFLAPRGDQQPVWPVRLRLFINCLYQSHRSQFSLTFCCVKTSLSLFHVKNFLIFFLSPKI